MPGPGRAAAAGQGSTPRLTLCSLRGQARVQWPNPVPMTWKGATATSDDTAPSGHPRQWATNSKGASCNGLPQPISAGLLHVKPKPRGTICDGIWGKSGSLSQGQAWPATLHCTKPDKLGMGSFPFKWFWLSGTGHKKVNVKHLRFQPPCYFA